MCRTLPRAKLAAIKSGPERESDTSPHNVTDTASLAALLLAAEPTGQTTAASAAAATAERRARHDHGEGPPPYVGVRPMFEDANGTVVVGEPGGSVTLDCRIFMLQDHTVSEINGSSLPEDACRRG